MSPGKRVAPRQEQAPEQDQRIERRGRRRPVAQIIAEIDQPIAGIEIGSQPCMKRKRGDGPRHEWRQSPKRGAAPHEPGVDFRIARRGRSQRRRLGGGGSPSGETVGRHARAQHLLDATNGRAFVDLLDRGEFTHQPVERPPW